MAVHIRIQLLAALLLAALLGGCATDPTRADAPPATMVQGLAGPWRTLTGAFLAPRAPQPGVLTRPGTGMFVKLQAPTALALRGQDLLVADIASGRLWRADLGFNTFTPIPGAQVGPATALLLGADLSAWVLDPGARQVLRFGREGQLLQTWRTRDAAPSPATMALLDAGTTLLVADTTLGQWAELRSGGALALPVRPHRAGELLAARVDALAAGREHVFVLDRLAASVHRVRRDGLIIDTLRAEALSQASTLVVDRWDRVFAPDLQGRHLLVLRAGAQALVLSAAELGVQQIGGVAVDDRYLAVSDRLVGQVQLLLLQPPEAR